jgi:hypothetical protein
MLGANRDAIRGPTDGAGSEQFSTAAAGCSTFLEKHAMQPRAIRGCSDFDRDVVGVHDGNPAGAAGETALTGEATRDSETRPTPAEL